jgi:hypothetical protein
MNNCHNSSRTRPRQPRFPPFAEPGILGENLFFFIFSAPVNPLD